MTKLKIDVTVDALKWQMNIIEGDRLAYTDVYDPHTGSVFGPYAFRYFMAGLYWLREFSEGVQREKAEEMYKLAEDYFINTLGMSTDVARYSSMIYTKKAVFMTDDHQQVEAKKVLRVDTGSGKGRRLTNRVFYEFSIDKRQVRIISDTPNLKTYLTTVTAFYLQNKKMIETLLNEVA